MVLSNVVCFHSSLFNEGLLVLKTQNETKRRALASFNIKNKILKMFIFLNLNSNEVFVETDKFIIPNSQTFLISQIWTKNFILQKEVYGSNSCDIYFLKSISFVR